jgi:hypothetical protein
LGEHQFVHGVHGVHFSRFVVLLFILSSLGLSFGLSGACANKHLVDQFFEVEHLVVEGYLVSIAPLLVVQKLVEEEVVVVRVVLIQILLFNQDG